MTAIDEFLGRRRVLEPRHFFQNFFSGRCLVKRCWDPAIFTEKCSCIGLLPTNFLDLDIFEILYD